MKFHVLVTGRNLPNLLDRCLKSIKDSGFTDITYCDDASSSEGVHPIDIALQNNVHVLSINERGGPYVTRKLGLDYLIDHNYPDDLIVVFVDGDDTISKHTLSLLTDAYSKGNDSVFGGINTPVWNNRAKDLLQKRINNISFDWNYMCVPSLRSFKLKLYRDLLDMDPTCSLARTIDGTFCTKSTDTALFTPIQALCDPHKIEILNTTTYLYHPQPVDPNLPPIKRVEPGFSDRLNAMVLIHKNKNTRV